MQMMAFQNTLQPIIDKLWLREDFAQHPKWLLKDQERKEMWKCGKVTLFYFFLQLLTARDIILKHIKTKQRIDF